MRRRPLLLAFGSTALAGVALLSLVSTSDAETPSRSLAASDQRASAPIVDAGAESAMLLTKSASSARQLAAIEDSVVTPAEYRTAIDAAVECMRSGGLKATAELQANGLYYQIHIDVDYDPSVTVRQCKQENSDFVEQAFSLRYVPHTAAEQAAYERAYADCRGRRDLRSDVKEAERCLGIAARAMSSTR